MKQEIYVKEMPDFCEECPFHNEENDKCILLPQYNIRPFLQSCPLKSLKDHDRELVKEVCEKIKDWCNKNFNWVGNGIGYDGQDYNEMIGSNNTINKLRGFLNQVQKEFENE